MSNRARKYRWFDRGAEALAQQYPQVRAQLPNAAYVCPLCDVPFERPAVDSGELTEEHVPPSSFGGRALVLSCARCNNAAGTKLDAHARRKENVAEILAGTFSGTTRVAFEQEGRRVNSVLAVSESTWNVRGMEHRNAPAVVEALRSRGLSAGTSIGIDLIGERFSEFGARLSWYRSGFLALFAVHGYRFTLDPAMRVVKDQLRSRERLIHSFTVDVAPNRSRLAWSDWRIVEIPHPRCTGVLFRQYLTLFPHPGDTGFYGRLEAALRAQPGSRLSFSGAGFYLAGRDPTFGLDPTRSD